MKTLTKIFVGVGVLCSAKYIQVIYHELDKMEIVEILEESRLQLLKLERFCWKSCSKVNLVKVINISKVGIYVI